MKRLKIGFDGVPHGTLTVRNGRLHAEGPNVDGVRHHAEAAVASLVGQGHVDLEPEQVLDYLAKSLQGRTHAEWERSPADTVTKGMFSLGKPEPAAPPRPPAVPAPAPAPAAAAPPKPAAPAPEPPAPKPADPNAPKVHPRIKAILDAAAQIPVHEKDIAVGGIRPTRPRDFDQVESVLTPDEGQMLRNRAGAQVDAGLDKEAARLAQLRGFYHQNRDDPRFAPKWSLDQWGRDEQGHRALAFRTSTGNQYTVRAIARREGEFPMHEVLFADQNGDFRTTGAGHAHEVFSKVNAAATALATKSHAPVLYFTAARDGAGKDPESRQKLYDRIVRTLAQAVPEYAAVAVTHPSGAKRYYAVKRNLLDQFTEHLKRAYGPESLEPLVKAYTPASHDRRQPHPPVIEHLTPATAEEIEHWHTPHAWVEEVPAADLLRDEDGVKENGTEPEVEKAFNSREPRDWHGRFRKQTDNPNQGRLFGDEPEPSSPSPLTSGGECSTVAIRAITGKPCEDKPRRWADTVFEIEDAGFKRDLSLTKEWSGRPVGDFAREANLPLAMVSVKGKPGDYDAHVMPMVDGRLHNLAGYGNEPIATVTTFTPVDKSKPLDTIPVTPGANNSVEDTMSTAKKPKPVIVSPGNRLIMGTSAPSYSASGDRGPTEFHYTSENGRWHVRQGNGGTMILTDLHNAHPQSSASIQGKFIVHGKLPEVEAKIEEVTQDEKKETPGKLSKHAENLLEHLKGYKLHNGQYSITTASGVGPQGGSRRAGHGILKAARELVSAGLAEWVGEPVTETEVSNGNHRHYKTWVLKVKGSA